MFSAEPYLQGAVRGVPGHVVLDVFFESIGGGASELVAPRTEIPWRIEPTGGFHGFQPRLALPNGQYGPTRPGARNLKVVLEG